MYSYGSPHMAAQKQDDQLERTFSSYVRIRAVVLKTCLGRWTIGGSGERGSGISVLPARYDDDDNRYWALSKLYCTWFGTNPQSELVTTNAVTIYIYIYIYIYTYYKWNNSCEANKDFIRWFLCGKVSFWCRCIITTNSECTSNTTWLCWNAWLKCINFI